MKLYLIPISSAHFHYNQETNTFSAYRSDLAGFKIFQQIHDDSCDAGFSMRSAKTGDKRTFLYTHDDRDSGGEDVYGWNFITDDGIKCLIIND